MDRELDLNQLAEDYVFGVLSPETLPSIAVQLLEAGHDSPTLRQLTGSIGEDSPTVNRLLETSFKELGITLPSQEKAALALARRIAVKIVDGLIAPYDGAKKIWSTIYVRFPQLKELTPFAGYASEYEDDERHREEYSKLIIEKSKKFLR